MASVCKDLSSIHHLNLNCILVHMECYMTSDSGRYLDRFDIVHECLFHVTPPLIFPFLTLHTKPDETRGSPFHFFWHSATSFSIFFCLQESPSSFLIFCSKLKFQKAQRVPPFTIFQNLALFEQ